MNNKKRAQEEEGGEEEEEEEGETRNEIILEDQPFHEVKDTVY
jgi:hypothetical protein